MKFMNLFLISLIAAVAVLFQPSMLLAQDAATSIDSGNTAWLLISTAMVMLMTPGLALFYGGMVRRKNLLNTLMLSFICLCLISVQWVLWGYTLAFGPDKGGIVGGLDFLGLNGVGLEPAPGSTIPHQLFMMFQGMFAIITPALITGAFIERIKFSTLIVFTLLWATFVYDPLAHWVWGGGWLMKLGAMDFAGGAVVHISCGASALVAAIVVGKRRGYPHEPMPPNNLPMTVLGLGLLWFGWFGFNAGSALAANGSAVNAFVTTNTSAGMATFTWAMLEWAHRGKPTILGVATGAIAGLGSITPAAGFVSPMSSIAIGFAASLFCYYAVMIFKPKMGYDDSLDVFGVHGVAGTWGTLATGLFASEKIGGINGLFYGNPGQFEKQAIAVAATYALAVVGTLLIFAALKFMGHRVSQEDEFNGLDLALHGESAYSHGFGGIHPPVTGER